MGKIDWLERMLAEDPDLAARVAAEEEKYQAARAQGKEKEYYLAKLDAAEKRWAACAERGAHGAH